MSDTAAQLPPRKSTGRGPLTGLRVLDLTSVVLGPLATQILADYGADVVKVESPEGDVMRANGVSKHPGMSSIFLGVNRNKRSVAIDLKSPRGLDAMRALVRRADVFIHNMRVPAIERLGLGYAAVEALNRRIVYCAATAFGQDGPHASRPAFDDIIQAASGLAALNADHGGPGFVPSLIADKTTGLAAVNAVLAALLHRERTGLGQYVEVPMLETMVAFLLAEHLGGLTFDPPIAPAGYHRILAGGRKPVRTLDGYVVLLPYTTQHWTAFFGGAGRADLVRKYQLRDRHEINARVKELYADMVEVAGKLTTDACLALCERIDVPATRIYQLEELPEHPHLKAVGMFRRIDHPTEGPLLAVRSPTRFDRSPAESYAPAPAIGEHTFECLMEAGLDDAALERLEIDGVIRQAETASRQLR